MELLDGEELRAVLARHPAGLPAGRAPDVGAQVVRDLLAKKPADRPADTHTVVRQLRGDVWEPPDPVRPDGADARAGTLGPHHEDTLTSGYLVAAALLLPGPRGRGAAQAVCTDPQAAPPTARSRTADSPCAQISKPNSTSTRSRNPNRPSEP